MKAIILGVGWRSLRDPGISRAPSHRSRMTASSKSLVLTLAAMLVATCCYGFYLVDPAVMFDSDHAVVSLPRVSLRLGQLLGCICRELSQ